MGYSMDMSQEKEKKELLPEGWREFNIIECKETKSKAGNDMFIFTFEDIETGSKDDIYAIATPGKRWFLKNILEACQVEASKDGIYDWEIEDVKNKKISGRIEHIDDSWINRKGETIQSKKHKIAEVRETTPF